MKIPLIALLCSTCILSNAQPSTVSFQTIPNYKSWGWNSVVMQNGLVTMATVPAIGGRVMQYDLGTIPSVFVNPSLLGKTYTPAMNSNWYNFGGYKTWPAPQSAWNAGGWPPPPTLDYGTYTILDSVVTADSVAVKVASPVEQWYAAGIRFVRTATLYPGSTHVKMEQTVINQGANSVTWSVWGVTESIVNHTGMTDYANYWVYFPTNPHSLYGTSGVKANGTSKAWKGEVAPGVYGVQYVADNQKIFADPQKGWIAYANLSDTAIFAKTFDVFEGMQYPDSGSRVAVYVSGSNPWYMEVETTGPLVTLDPAGGSYTFTENWWTAKVRAPVIDVNMCGAIAARLSYIQSTHVLAGIYGVFHEGTLRVEFADGSGQLLLKGPLHIVTPLRECTFSDTIPIPAGAKVARVVLHTVGGDSIGVLDSADVAEFTSGVTIADATRPAEFRLNQNYPNPFNPTTVVSGQWTVTSDVSLEVFDILGRRVATLANGRYPAGKYSFTFNANGLASGVYFYRLKAGSYSATMKMVLVR